MASTMASKRLRKSGTFYKNRDRRTELFEQQWREEHGGEHIGATIPAVGNTIDLPVIIESPVNSLTEFLNEEEERVCDSEEDEQNINYDDSDSEIAIVIEEKCFEDDLRVWALLTNQTHRALNMLLALLRKTSSLDVPKDARTLLQTRNTTNDNLSSTISVIAGGRLWYQNVGCCLQDYYSKVTPNLDTFCLDFFIDGLPLHKTGLTQFWPILMKVFNVPEQPVMVVGVFCGETKPLSVEEYLRPLVTELNDLQENGIIINGHKFSVLLRAVIADTPARAFIKGVKSFNSASGCLKCTIDVVRDPETHRSYYEGINAESRTHEKFKAKEYQSHYKNPTPLTDLINCDIIKDIIVADDLHLLHLGVMKKLLKGWINGDFGKQPKLTISQCESISKYLRALVLPCEIPRKMRELKYFPIWKGSEFGSFLLFASAVVLKDKISDEAYEHFMLLFCGVTFFSSSVHEKYWQYAGRLLDLFVENFGEVYDKTLISSNIHNLHHVYEDVCRFGSLSTISSYPFENHLQNMKRVTRSKKQCLEQIRNRIVELKHINSAQLCDRTSFPKLKIKGSGVTVFVKSDFVLKNDNRNKWFLLKDNSIFKYESATQVSSEIFIHGSKFTTKRDSFSRPCPSSYLNIYDVDMNELCEQRLRIPLSEVKCKFAAIPKTEDRKFTFIPIPNSYL